MWACENCHDKVVAMLLERNADIEAKEKVCSHVVCCARGVCVGRRVGG
jgi:hypothetical protein